MILMVGFNGHFLVFAAILVRLFAGDFFELFVEVGDRLKSAFVTDTVDIHLVFLQELTGIFDADLL